MKRISPTSAIWILVHFVILLLGIIAFSAEKLFPGTGVSKEVAQGVGGSLIAAGIAGEILFLYLRSSEAIQERFEIFIKAGLTKVFAHRSVRIKDEYHVRLRKVTELDIIGFGLSSFRQDYADEFAELSRRAIVRVLIIDPDFPAGSSSFASLRDIEEENPTNQIKTDVEAFIESLAKTSDLRRDRFKVRKLTAIPAINLFRIDDEIFWGPYLVGQQSRNMPTLLVQRGGFLFDALKKHFDNLWADDRFSHPVTY